MNLAGHYALRRTVLLNTAGLILTALFFLVLNLGGH